MRHLIKLFIIVLLASFFFTGIAAADSAPLTVFIDGKRINFEAPPMIKDGTTLVPMRKIFETLGAKVNWDEKNEIVSATRHKTEIVYKIGEKHAQINGAYIELSTEGKMIDGTTMIPLRFIAESLGALVGWEPNKRIITISSYPYVKAKVIRVYDSDHIEVLPVEGDHTKPKMIRLILGNSTDKVDSSAETAAFVKQQLEGKNINIVIDHHIGQDKNGRWAAYVFLEDGTFLNGQLVANGHVLHKSKYPLKLIWGDYFHLLQENNNNGLLHGMENEQPIQLPKNEVTYMWPKEKFTIYWMNDQLGKPEFGLTKTEFTEDGAKSAVVINEIWSNLNT